MSKNLKLKKIIKIFVTEPISCFSDSCMRYEHLWTLSVSVWICLFHIFISWSYVFGCGYATQTLTDSVTLDMNEFINFWLQPFNTRRETQIIKAYADLTLHAQRILWCLRFLPVETQTDQIRKTQNALQRSKLQLFSKS